jgi:hypothetical protein
MRLPFINRGPSNGPAAAAEAADVHNKVATWLESSSPKASAIPLPPAADAPHQTAKSDATVVVAPESGADNDLRLPTIAESRAAENGHQQHIAAAGDASKDPLEQQQQQQEKEGGKKGVAAGMTRRQCVGFWAFILLLVALFATAATLLPVFLLREPNPPYKGYAEIQQRSVVSNAGRTCVV